MSVLDLSSARLTVTWEAVGTHQVLAAYHDRTVWFWALATIGSGSDLVGSFATQVPADAWSAVPELAGDVDALARAARNPTPGELGLRVGSGTTTAWLPLGGEAAARVNAVAQPLLGLVRQHPIAVARLTTLVATAPTGQRVAGFSMASVGSEPVSLMLDPDALVLTLGGAAELLPPPRMGLVAGDGTLLDGLYQPARIEPRANGACTVLLDAPSTDPDTAVTGRMQGSITLVGPWDVAPTLPFEATSAPTTERRPG